MRVNYRQLIGCLLVFCGPTRAEELDINKDPVSIPAGPFTFSPIFEMAESYNDNLFNRNIFKKASFLTQFHAGGQLALERQLNRYALTYTLQSSQYHQSPQDDYIDHFVGGSSHLEFTSRNRLDVNFGYLDSHYQRGVFLGRDLLFPTQRAEPDQYHLHNAAATYRYGRSGAKGNLELRFNVQDYTFQNNREFTARQDRTLLAVTPGFYFRFSPKTTLHTQVENEFLKYRQTEASAYDYTKQRFLIGGTWLYSAKTRVSGQFGYLRQEFDNPIYKGVNGPTWDLSVGWSPLSYSRFNLGASSDVTGTLGNSNVRISDRYRLSWVHDWTPRVTTQVFGALENANNQGIKRKDNFTALGVDLSYGFRRWLGIGITYTYRSLESDNNALNFDQNKLMIYLTGNPRISDEAKTPWGSWY